MKWNYNVWMKLKCGFTMSSTLENKNKSTAGSPEARKYEYPFKGKENDEIGERNSQGLNNVCWSNKTGNWSKC